MDKIYTAGTIKLKDDLGFVYRIAKIEYDENKSGDFKYTFTPCYSVIDILPVNLFQGIPGIDLSLREEKYVRKNIVPTFIEERTPGPNREGLWELLEACDMDYLNRLEWLIRSKSKYLGDRMYVDSFNPEFDMDKEIAINSLIADCSRSINSIKKVLEMICYGYNLSCAGQNFINDENRKSSYDIFIAIYLKDKKFLSEKQQLGIASAKKRGKYAGRKRLQIDDTVFEEVAYMFSTKQISEKEACSKLDISRSSFYRRLKEKLVSESKKQDTL